MNKTSRMKKRALPILILAVFLASLAGGACFAAEPAAGPGSGEAILFTRLEPKSGQSHLWLLPPRAKPIRLTSGAAGVQAFAYSPLRRILVYQKAVSEYSEDFSLFALMRKTPPDGETAILFTPPAGRSDHNPVFSPKGDHLAFNRLDFARMDEPEYDAGVFIAHYEKGLGSPVKMEKINGLRDYIHIPICFSPDSRYLAVQRAPLAEFATGDSLIIDVEKGTPLHVMKDTRVEGWSPDGKSILLTAMRKDEPGVGIFIAEVGRQERKPVTVSGFSDEDPRWSPDGRSILCHSRTIDGESLGIWKINVKTGDRVLLTENGGNARWALDGGGIFLLRNPSDGDAPPDLYWMDAEGKLLKKVLKNAGGFELIPWAEGEKPAGEKKK